MPSTYIPPATLDVAKDPHAFDSVRNFNIRPGTGSSSDSERVTRQPRPGFFSRLFKPKAAKQPAQKPATTGFVLPYELEKQQQQQQEPSERSRPSRTTEAARPPSEPVYLTTGTIPTILKHQSTWTVHEYCGDGQPAQQPESVRFLHPAVTDYLLPPPTPSASGSESRPPTADTPSFYIPPKEDSPNSSTVLLPDAASPLNPRHIWENAAQFNKEDEPTTFLAFKARFDGLPAPEPAEPAPPILPHPPSLHYIPAIGAFTIDDEPIFHSDATVEENRKAALEKLEPPAGTHPSILTPQQYPQLLVPGKSARPFSMPATLAGEKKPVYRPYRPGITSTLPTGAEQPRVPAPNPRLITPDFDHTRSQHTIPRKPVLKQQSQPPAPAPTATASSSSLPKKSYSSRYPPLNLASAQRFSAEPRYQRRTIDDEEAKFRKERAVRERKLRDELRGVEERLGRL